MENTIPVTMLRLPRVLEKTGVARSTWWLWVKNGTAPKPVRLGVRAVAWRSSDINEWLESREVA